MKRVLYGTFLFLLLSCSTSVTFSQQVNGTQDASQLSLKERWMRVPAELKLTPTQMTQYKEYQSALHNGLKEAHHEMHAKLEKVLTSEQMENLRQWGTAYRQKREERSLHSNAEMNDSLHNASQQLKLTPEQDQQFKAIALEDHRKKHQLFDQFYSKVNKILTSTQKAKFSEIREDL